MIPDMLGLLKERENRRKREQAEKDARREKEEGAAREARAAAEGTKATSRGEDPGKSKHRHHHKSSHHHHSSSSSHADKSAARAGDRAAQFRAPVKQALAKFAAMSSTSVVHAAKHKAQSTKHSGV